MSPDTQVGPITNKPQFEKILELHRHRERRRRQSRCSAAARAERPECGDGWFVEPTIFTGVNNRMRIAQEEVFGPVLSVIPFEDEEEAIAIGNDVVYGLAAGVWTQNMRRALTMAERLQAGTVWVNTYRAVSYRVAVRRLQAARHWARERPGDDQGVPAGEERVDLDGDDSAESIYSTVAGFAG